MNSISTGACTGERASAQEVKTPCGGRYSGGRAAIAMAWLVSIVFILAALAAARSLGASLARILPVYRSLWAELDRTRQPRPVRVRFVASGLASAPALRPKQPRRTRSRRHGPRQGRTGSVRPATA